MRKLLTTTLFGIFAATTAMATNYYVSITGSDDNNGLTRGTAFATIGKAQSMVTAGDNVYILPGTYNVTEDQISKETSTYKMVFNFSQKGSYGKPISFVGLTENGQRPVFDMSAVNPTGYRITGFYVTGQYLVFRNFEVIGMMVNVADHTQSENFRIDGGKHNTYDNIACHDGMGIGFYLINNSSHNLFINCDCYNNYDSVSEDGKGGQNDGFGCHVRAGNENNIFIGCRAWNNSDDGYDLISCYSPVTFCYSIAYKNGYDGDGNKRQDGNGFKAGGYGMSAKAETLPDGGAPRHQVYHCLAIENKSNGFYSNHHLGGLDFTTNTSVRNGGTNYNMLNRQGPAADENVDVPGYGHALVDNLSVHTNTTRHAANLDTTDGVNTVDGNSFSWNGSSWTNSYSATFVSTTATLANSPRLANGMLNPETTLTLYQQTTYTGIGCDFSGYEAAILAAKEISGAEQFTGSVAVTSVWNFNQYEYDTTNQETVIGTDAKGVVNFNGLFVHWDGNRNFKARVPNSTKMMIYNSSATSTVPSLVSVDADNSDVAVTGFAYKTPCAGVFTIKVYAANTGRDISIYSDATLANYILDDASSASSHTYTKGFHTLTYSAAGEETLYIVPRGGAVYFDEFKFVPTFAGTATKNITIGSAGKATFCAPQSYDLPAGLKAYIVSAASLTKLTATLTEIDEIPACTGVILVGNAGNYTLTSKEATTTNVESNLLQANVGNYNLPKTKGVYINYTLAANGFVQSTGNGTLGMGKAYLRVDGSAYGSNNAKQLSFDFLTGEATGILGIEILPGNTVNDNESIGNNTINNGGSNKVYSITGQQVGNGYKGVVIKNGKKYLYK